jgi:hypothetical protein
VAALIRVLEHSGPNQLVKTAGANTVHINPAFRRVRRIALSLIRQPMGSREFPAHHERLVTLEELLRLGV